MINSRKTEDLLPVVAEKMRAFITACAAQGIEIIPTSTYRDKESQAALYAQGRTQPGKIVTNARPGQSFHQYRVAMDVVPIMGGKAIWNDNGLWEHIGEIGESVGLTWAGRWKSFHEEAHFQYTGGLTLADFQAGKTLS